MQIKTLKPNLLILDRTHPLGAVLDVPDEIGRRHLEAQSATVVTAIDPEYRDAESAAIAPDETAEASPRPRPRKV